MIQGEASVPPPETLTLISAAGSPSSAVLIAFATVAGEFGSYVIGAVTCPPYVNVNVPPEACGHDFLNFIPRGGAFVFRTDDRFARAEEVARLRCSGHLGNVAGRIKRRSPATDCRMRLYR